MLFTESIAHFTPFSRIHFFAYLTAACLSLPSGMDASKSL